jgi:hypothetical protein
MIFSPGKNLLSSPHHSLFTIHCFLPFVLPFVLPLLLPFLDAVLQTRLTPAIRGSDHGELAGIE